MKNKTSILLKRLIITLSAVFGLAANSWAERPELLFREDFKETPAAIPVTQEHISSSDLTLEVYGPGKDLVKKSHHDQPLDDPYYVWSGLAEGNWLVSLKYRSPFDLTGQSKVRWRSKQSGFRQLRLALKLTSGEWIVSDLSDGPSSDWRIKEFNISDIRWRALRIESIAETHWVESPDLSAVEAIAWTDLMIGGASEACSRLDWIEVYARESK